MNEGEDDNEDLVDHQNGPRGLGREAETDLPNDVTDGDDGDDDRQCVHHIVGLAAKLLHQEQGFVLPCVQFLLDVVRRQHLII